MTNSWPFVSFVCNEKTSSGPDSNLYPTQYAAGFPLQYTLRQLFGKQ